MSLSTHVLDLVTGQPATGLRIMLYHDGMYLNSEQTDADGRSKGLLGGLPVKRGGYRLVFAAGEYLKRTHPDVETPFFDEVPVDFTISDEDRHYHVPLLLSPFGYSTYRGS